MTVTARATLTLTSSLLEKNHDIGLVVSGSNATVTATLIRQTQPQVSDMGSGKGAHVQHSSDRRGSLTLSSSRIDQSSTTGLVVVGADATVENTVIQDTQPQASDMTSGLGILVVADGGQRGLLTLRSSRIDRSHGMAVAVQASDASVENTVIENTKPQVSDMTSGIGVLLLNTGEERGKLSLSSSLVDQSYDAGVLAQGSDITVKTTAIRDTKGQTSDGAGGYGILVLDNGGQRGVMALSTSLIEQSHSQGVAVVGSDATIASVVVRDTQPTAANMTHGEGIAVQDLDGERGSLTLSSSLLDNNYTVGLSIIGSDATVTSTVMRNTQAQVSDMTFGWGVGVQNDAGGRSALTMSSSLLDGNHDRGMFVWGSDATMQTSIIRNTQPMASDMTRGRGIGVSDNAGERGMLNVSASLLDHNTELGILVFGSDATVQGSVIRDTQPQVSDHEQGVGIQVTSDGDNRSSLMLSASLIEKNYTVGMIVQASDSTVTNTLIRNTRPQASDMNFGWGLGVQDIEGNRGVLSLTSSMIDQSHQLGLFIAGSDATVLGTIVRNGQPRPSDSSGGLGIVVMNGELGGNPEGNPAGSSERGALTLTSSLIEHHQVAGVQVVGSDATLKSSVIRDTQVRSSDNTFGDGISVTLAQITIESCFLDHNARAALSNFGSTVKVRQVETRCSPILFDEETQSTDPFDDQPITPLEATYEPQNIACFDCDGSTLSCKAVSQHLEAPKPVEALKSSQTAQ